MDLFPGIGRHRRPAAGDAAADDATTGLTMGYYDGNTVTALWNYAQHFAMSDNSTTPTSVRRPPGAINLISGQTNGVIAERQRHRRDDRRRQRRPDR